MWCIDAPRSCPESLWMNTSIHVDNHSLTKYMFLLCMYALCRDLVLVINTSSKGKQFVIHQSQPHPPLDVFSFPINNVKCSDHTLHLILVFNPLVHQHVHQHLHMYPWLHHQSKQGYVPLGHWSHQHFILLNHQIPLAVLVLRISQEDPNNTVPVDQVGWNILVTSTIIRRCNGEFCDCTCTCIKLWSLKYRAQCDNTCILNLLVLNLRLWHNCCCGTYMTSQTINLLTVDLLASASALVYYVCMQHACTNFVLHN